MFEYHCKPLINKGLVLYLFNKTKNHNPQVPRSNRGRATSRIHNQINRLEKNLSGFFVAGINTASILCQLSGRRKFS